MIWYCFYENIIKNIYKVIKFNGYGSEIIEILKRLEYQNKV